MSDSTKWLRVSRRDPCPACGKPDHCAWTPDGERLKCERTTDTPPGFELVSHMDGGALFRPLTATTWRSGSTGKRRSKSQPSVVDLERGHEGFRAALDGARRRALAGELGVTVAALDTIEIGWADARSLRLLGAGGKDWKDSYPDGAYSFPERDGSSTIVGFSFRTVDGRKGSAASSIGARRGLIVPAGFAQRSGVVIVVEGASDTAALESMGLLGVGRPSNASGGDDLARLLDGREVVVLGENDKKDDGAWPGRDGAQSVARSLADAWGVPVKFALPPPQSKDARDWLREEGAAGADVNSTSVREALASKFFAAVSRSTQFVRSRAPKQRTWPEPIAAAAFHGVAGDFVRLVEPQSEADAGALLVQFLVAAGSVLGRSAYMQVEDTRHYCNLYAVVVGDTAKARKGTSLGRVTRVMGQVDPNWSKTCVVKGLSSGEGLIWHVRDAPDSDRPAVEDLDGSLVKKLDAGVADKRTLVIESEFASVFRHARREGNVLSTVLRDAWDSGNLCTLTKKDPAHATDAHISVIAHITSEELARELSETDAANGFGNRFLWLCVRRSKLLPDGGALPEAALEEIAERVTLAVQDAQGLGRVHRDEQAKALWHEVYPRLSRVRPGLAGALGARADAQVLRLSLLYALLDGSQEVRVDHLRAALALFEYVERSIDYLFGNSLGDPLADELLSAICESEGGLTRTDLRNLFNRNRAAKEIGAALARLEALRLVEKKLVKTDGRPAECWIASGAVDAEAGGDGDLWSSLASNACVGEEGREQGRELQCDLRSSRSSHLQTTDATDAAPAQATTETTETTKGRDDVELGDPPGGCTTETTNTTEGRDAPPVRVAAPERTTETTETTETTKGSHDVRGIARRPVTRAKPAQLSFPTDAFAAEEFDDVG